MAERTGEIGLLRALGARREQVLLLFLAEAALLAGIGGLSGLALGTALAQLLHAVFPALPVTTPWSYAAAAEVVGHRLSRRRDPPATAPRFRVHVRVPRRHRRLGRTDW